MTEHSQSPARAQKQGGPVRRLFRFFLSPSLLPFLIIGGVNTLIAMGGTYIFHQIVGWPFFPVHFTFFALTSVISFVCNRRFSFKSSAPLAKSILRFTVLVSLCYFISYGLQYILLPWAKTHWFPGMSDVWYTVIRLLFIQVIFTALNYVGQRLWAFAENK